MFIKRLIPVVSRRGIPNILARSYGRPLSELNNITGPCQKVDIRLVLDNNCLQSSQIDGIKKNSNSGVSSGVFCSTEASVSSPETVDTTVFSPYNQRFVDAIPSCVEEFSVTDPQATVSAPEGVEILPSDKSIVNAVGPSSLFGRTMSSTWRFTKKFAHISKLYIVDSKQRREMTSHAWKATKSGCKHIWTCCKLYGRDMVTAEKLLWQMIQGKSLTHREKEQLIDAMKDTMKLVPFTAFMIIPFTEFALPFVLKFFPNFLPKAFNSEAMQSSQKQKLLDARIQMARDYKIWVKRSLNVHRYESEENMDSADDLLKSVKRIQAGQTTDLEHIVEICQYFKDSIVVDHIDNPQLKLICKYMGIMTFAGDEMSRIGLRTRIRSIVQDDKLLYFEDLNAMTAVELARCCENRGMTHHGLHKKDYLDLLNQWIDCSMNKHIPISVLLISNIINLVSKEATLEHQLMNAVGMLNDDVVKEAIINATPVTDKKGVELRYERAKKEAEKIEEENEERKAYVSVIPPAVYTMDMDNHTKVSDPVVEVIHAIESNASSSSSSAVDSNSSSSNSEYSDAVSTFIDPLSSSTESTKPKKPKRKYTKRSKEGKASKKGENSVLEGGDSLIHRVKDDSDGLLSTIESIDSAIVPDIVSSEEKPDKL